MKFVHLIIFIVIIAQACEKEFPKIVPAVSEGVKARLVHVKPRPAEVLDATRMPAQVVVPKGASWVVGPSVEARLIKWSVVNGSDVEVGDTLATLVSPELGDLSSLASELSRVVKDRQKNAGRLKESVKAGFKSSASLYDAELSLNEAKAQLQRVRRQLRIRNANVRRGAKSEWEWISPVSGRVSSIDCDPGGLYSSESRCITIIKKDATRVRVDVSEKMAGTFGEKVRQAKWYAPRSNEPRILSLDRREFGFDQLSRTQAFYFEADGLEMGSAGTIELLIPVPKGALRIPRESVVKLRGKDTVFVVGGEESPKPVAVEVIGREEGDHVVLGISIEDSIVSQGAFALKSIVAFK